MKYLFYNFIFIYCQIGFSQTTTIDSLKLVNDELDAQILEKIKIYESDSIDFIFLRVYDTLVAENNRCTFMISQDSCNSRFALAVNHNFTIHHITIGYPDYYVENQKCKNQVTEVIYNLTVFDNYFKTEPTNLPEFKRNGCTFYGKINSECLLETFNQGFLNTFHHGMLYDTICNYMGVRCSYH
jgi:hypothetical protein